MDVNHAVVEQLKPEPEGFRQSYLDYIKGQVTELLTNYGKIDVLWFDGGPKAIEMEAIRQMQPGIVVNPRMHGYGDFETWECRLPDERPKDWWEHCTFIGAGWAYKKNEDVRPLSWLMDYVARTRSWGGNVLVNVAPRPTGELPQTVYAFFDEMQEWIAHSGESIFDTQGGPWPEKCNFPVTVRGSTWYVHVISEPNEPVQITTDQKPKRIALLRNNESLSAHVIGGKLIIDVPKESKTGCDDVIQITW